MDQGTKRAVIVWHRRSGKDKTVLQVVIKKMLERVGTYFYIFPTYSQGKKALWDGIDRDGFKLMDHFPEALVVKKNESDMKIELFNGSIFQIIGSDNIDRVVGTNPVGVVFSEFPVGKASAWDFIRPILAENGGFAIFDFTPRGMNHGWKILQQAKATPGWFWQVLTAEDTEVLSPQVLAEEKASMPEDLYFQEYFCKFLDGASQFFKGIEKVVYDDRNSDIEERWGYKPGKLYRLGVDLGKHQDFTVITPIDLNTFKVGPIERFNQMDWPLQKSKIETQYYKYGKSEIRMDSTGLGDPIYDDLTDKGLKISPYVFTEKSRENLLKNLAILIEQEIIRLPNNQVLLDELRSFQYELTESGKVRIVVPDGLHDDCVMSLALAVWDLPVNKIPFKTLEDKKVLREFDAYRNKTKSPYPGMR